MADEVPGNEALAEVMAELAALRKELNRLHREWHYHHGHKWDRIHDEHGDDARYPARRRKA